MVEEEEALAAFKDYVPSAESSAPSTPAPSEPTPPPAAPKPLPTPPVPTAHSPPPPPPPVSTPPPAASAPVQSSGGRVIASPLAKRLATEQGINLTVSTLVVVKFFLTEMCLIIQKGVIYTCIDHILNNITYEQRSIKTS